MEVAAWHSADGFDCDSVVAFVFCDDFRVLAVDGFEFKIRAADCCIELIVERFNVHVANDYGWWCALCTRHIVGADGCVDER